MSETRPKKTQREEEVDEEGDLTLDEESGGEKKTKFETSEEEQSVDEQPTEEQPIEEQPLQIVTVKPAPKTNRNQIMKTKRLITKNKDLRRVLNQDVVKLSSELRELKSVNNDLATKSAELEQRIQQQLKEKEDLLTKSTTLGQRIQQEINEKQQLEEKLRNVKTNIKQDSQLQNEIRILKRQIGTIMNDHAKELRDINSELETEEKDLIEMLSQLDENSLRKQIIDFIESDLSDYYEGDLSETFEKFKTKKLLKVAQKIEKIIQEAQEQNVSIDKVQASIDALFQGRRK